MLTLLLTVFLLWFYIRFFIPIMPSPWPVARKFGQYTWRQVYKNQYDRRGFLHACGHLFTILVLVITIHTPDNASTSTWAKIAMLWCFLMVYWFLLGRYQQFQGGRRRLPKHRKYRRRR